MDFFRFLEEEGVVSAFWQSPTPSSFWQRGGKWKRERVEQTPARPPLRLTILLIEFGSAGTSLLACAFYPLPPQKQSLSPLPLPSVFCLLLQVGRWWYRTRDSARERKWYSFLLPLRSTYVLLSPSFVFPHPFAQKHSKK